MHVSASCCAFAGALFLFVAPADARDVLGVSHAAGRYNFTGDDYLNEVAGRGAIRALRSVPGPAEVFRYVAQEE